MIRTIALGLSGLLIAGPVWAGEDKPAQRQDKEKPAAAAKPDTGKSFDVDAFMKKYDKNGDGCLSRSELPPLLQHRFAEFDTNKDGKLSVEELRAHMECLQNWQAHMEHRRARLMAFGGYVSNVASSDRPVLKLVQNAYELLQRTDANRDGKIDAEEWDAARQKLREARIDAMLERQGAGKDGKISKAQAYGRLRRHFDQWDLNHDGFIDREELNQVFSHQVAFDHPEKNKTKHIKATEVRKEKK